MVVVTGGRAAELDWNTVEWPDQDAREARFVNVDGSGFDVEIILTGDFGTDPFVTVQASGPGSDSVLSIGPVNWEGLPPSPNDALENALQVTINFYHTGSNTLADLDNLTLVVGDVDANYFGTTPVSYNDELTFSGTPTITDRVTGPSRMTNPHYIDGSVVRAWEGTGEFDGVAAPDNGGGLASSDPEGYLDVAYVNGGGTYSYVYTNGPGTSSNPVGQLTTLGNMTFNAVPVPEPGTLLLVLGALGLLGWRRRR
ncbi:hypothetical protein BH23VER1_BH23VER1_24430 [soil metagenome]